MRPYEVMIILDVDLEEADIRERLDRVTQLIRSRGDTPGKVDHWGRRSFAYEVKHRSEGYYVVLEATAEPATMAEVDRLLALEDAVLRHKVIRQHEKEAGRSTGSMSRRTAPSSAQGQARESAPEAAAPASI